MWKIFDDKNSFEFIPLKEGLFKISWKHEPFSISKTASRYLFGKLFLDQMLVWTLTLSKGGAPSEYAKAAEKTPKNLNIFIFSGWKI